MGTKSLLNAIFTVLLYYKSTAKKGSVEILRSVKYLLCLKLNLKRIHVCCRYGSYDDFADDLIGLVDEMELKSTVFIGHSMSGMVGCIASVKRPDLFQRLLLVGATPRLSLSKNYFYLTILL